MCGSIFLDPASLVHPIIWEILHTPFHQEQVPRVNFHVLLFTQTKEFYLCIREFHSCGVNIF